MNTRLSIYLSANHITQAQLATITSVSKSTISHFLSGHPITSNNLQRIIQSCKDLSLEWLFFGVGAMLKGDYADDDIPALIAEKDRIISARDETITKKDATICRMQELLLQIGMTV